MKNILINILVGGGALILIVALVTMLDERVVGLLIVIGLAFLLGSGLRSGK